MLKQNLQVLDELDPCYLECDGLSSVISSLLSAVGISHNLFVGSAKKSGNIGISPHLWIEVDDYIIDYRLRMWLGDDPSIPHGIFKRSECSHITYSNSAYLPIGDREALARILCFTSGIAYDDIVLKLKESLQGTV